jgi:hypothetical protein
MGALATEVMDVVKNGVGTELFLPAYSLVREKVTPVLLLFTVSNSPRNYTTRRLLPCTIPAPRMSLTLTQTRISIP